MDLMCQDVHFGLGEKKILKGVSLKVEGHQFHTILGPNGSGKTSLLKLLYRQEKADKGLISLDGKPLEHWSLKETAKQMAVVTQFNQLQFDCMVEESSCWEELPTSLFLQKERKGIMPSFKMLSSRWICLRRKLVSIRLFQGEKQRVLLARALAQEPTSCSWMNQPITWYQVSARLVGHCEESQGQCSSCPAWYSTCLSLFGLSLSDERGRNPLPRNSKGDHHPWVIANCIRSSKSGYLDRGSASMIHYL